MSRAITIKLSSLHLAYKPSLKIYYDRYWGKEDNQLWIGNHPMSVFASDYVKYGRDVLKNLEDHVFIRYEYDRYKDAPTFKEGSHASLIANHVIRIVDSVRKYGYCSGKYDKKKNMILVYKPSDQTLYSNRDDPTDDIYVFRSRKHRACSCYALSISEIRVRFIGV